MSAVNVEPVSTAGSRARAGTAPVVSRRSRIWSEIWRDRLMLLMVLPGVVYFIVYHYLPLLGYIIAFQDYLPFLGFADSPFVGLANFQSMVSDGAFWQAVPGRGSPCGHRFAATVRGPHRA